jgi:uncharacterized protein (DUF1330 family)
VAVYMIVELEVLDPETYARYVERVPALVQKHGGRYVVRGDAVTPLGGGWDPERIVVMEYRQLAPLRESSTVSRSILVEGCLPAEAA